MRILRELSWWISRSAAIAFVVGAFAVWHAQAFAAEAASQVDFPMQPDGPTETDAAKALCRNYAAVTEGAVDNFKAGISESDAQEGVQTVLDNANYQGPLRTMAHKAIDNVYSYPNTASVTAREAEIASFIACMKKSPAILASQQRAKAPIQANNSPATDTDTALVTEIRLVNPKFQYDGSRHVDYVAQLKNTSNARAKGSMCIASYDKNGFKVEETPGDDVNMGVNDSESITGYLISTPKELSETSRIVLYVATYGCADSADEAISNVSTISVK